MSDFQSKNTKKKIKTSLNEILNIMTEDTNKPKKISLNDILQDRSNTKVNESPTKIYHSPKNSFERNYNKLFKEFKSTDSNSINTFNYIGTSEIPKNKRGVSLELDEKIHLKALQCKMGEKSKPKKDVKTKLKEMKVSCLTQNFLQAQIDKQNVIEEFSNHKFYSSDFDKPIQPEFLVKTESKLKKNDFISEKIKLKMIDVYKKANQSNIFENDFTKNSISILTEYSPIVAFTPIGKREISFNTSNYSNNLNKRIEFLNSQRSNNFSGYLESSPNRIKLKQVQKEIASLLNGNDKKKDGVVSKIKSILDDNSKKSNGLNGDYKTFLNFDSWNSNNNEIVSMIKKKFPDVVKSKNRFGLKRLVSFHK